MGGIECSQAISAFEGARGAPQLDIEKAVYNLANSLIKLARTFSDLKGLEREARRRKQDTTADSLTRNSIANEEGPP